MVKIVIIGLGAAGFGAALAAKKQDRTAEITLIDEKDFDLMHQCGLPYAIEGEIQSLASLKHCINAEKMGMKVISKTKVNKIDFNKKIVDCEAKQVSYDKLIIATGAIPFIPPIKTSNKVFTVHNMDDTKELESNIRKGEKAIIIGAGAVGLETAVALNKKGMNVEVVDILPLTFPKAIDKDISEILEAKLREKGIKLELGKKIEEIKEKALVVMATGVRPNISFLKDSKIKINKFGVEANEKMESSIKDVYAAGDCCSVLSLINREEMPSQLANNAYKQGTVAGINAAGGDKKYEGILNTFVSVIGDIEVASTGFNSFFAEFYGIEPITAKAKGKNRPEWFGQAKDLTVKIIADQKGKVIGGQAIGEGAKERINILSTVIKAGLTLKDVSELELAYSPVLSEYYDVLVIAADLGWRKVKK